MSSPPFQESTSSRASLLAGVVLLLFTIGVAAAFVFRAQVNFVHERAERDLQHRAALYEAYIRANVWMIDQALQALRADIVNSGVPSNLREWVDSRSMLREPLFQFAVADKHGRLIASSEFGANTGLDLSDRQHIRVQLDGTTDAMYFSVPLIGRASGRLSINVTRPVVAADGTVVAVVITSVNPQHFSTYLQDFSAPSSHLAQLVGVDGVIRARSDQNDAPLGGTVRDPALLKLMQMRKASVTRAAFGVDGRPHLVAYRPVEGYDLNVVVGLDVQHLDASQIVEGRVVVGFSLVVALLVVAMGIAYDRIAAMNAGALELRARSEERRSQLERMGALLSDCDAILLLVDSTGRVLASNPAFRRMFQFTSPNDADDGPVADDVAVLVSRAISAPRFPFRISGVAEDRNGIRREFIWSWIKLQKETSNDEEFLGVAVDHTDLRQKELMLIHASKLSSLGRQSAAVCHELSQPLNVVSLGLDNLRRDITGGVGLDGQIKRLDRLSNSIRRAGRILDRFRSFVRVPSRPLESLHVRALVVSAIDSVADLFNQNGIRIQFRADADAVVRANRLELEQVFVNILINAAESIIANSASGEETGLVTVSLDLVSEEDRIEISFRDDGCGLPEDFVRFGIRPFSSTKEEQGGIGLGLAISDATIQSLGGKIRFMNVENGAVFFVSLPVRRQHD